MKKIIILFCLILFNKGGDAQVNPDDFGRIVINTYLPDKIELPDEAKSLLLTKLNQIASNNGMGGSSINPRFIITANVNIVTKDIIAGPPQMISLNLEVTFFIVDAIDNIIFSNTTLSLKGVGTNENKALIDAFKNINIKNTGILALLEEGRNKIIKYYSAQCDYIVTEANTLTKLEKFDEAFYKLSVIPKVCKDCNAKIESLLENIYQQKINSICLQKYYQAKIIWAGSQKVSSAENVLNTLIEINPSAACNNDVEILIKEIKNKLIVDEKEQLELVMKKYNDKIRLEEKRVDAIKEIAVEFAKNQPKKVIDNNIYWR